MPLEGQPAYVCCMPAEEMHIRQILLTAENKQFEATPHESAKQPRHSQLIYLAICESSSVSQTSSDGSMRATHKNEVHKCTRQPAQVQSLQPLPLSPLPHPLPLPHARRPPCQKPLTNHSSLAPLCSLKHGYMHRCVRLVGQSWGSGFWGQVAVQVALTLAGPAAMAFKFQTSGNSPCA